MLRDTMKNTVPLVGMIGVTLAFGLTWAVSSLTPLQAQAPEGNQIGPGSARGGGQGMGMMRSAAPLPVTEEEAMPPEARKIMRDQMKQFLVSLSRIQGLLAEGDLAEAAQLAEVTMGRSEQGQHRGQGPGRYMPVPMRNLAWGMHEAASEFATTAATGDVLASYKSLQKIQNSCVACHFSYRNR